jgi:hypothetical protein
LALALGEADLPAFVSETRNLYRHELCLLPMEDGPAFEIFQEHGLDGKQYPGCKITGFEFRIMRDEGNRESAIKLKLDIAGTGLPDSYAVTETTEFVFGERFKEDGVTYAINGNEHSGIYGVTVSVTKEAATRTEVKIHRIAGRGEEPGTPIESLEITAHLRRTKYQNGNGGEYQFGLFKLRLTRLVLMADETAVDSGGAVIGPLRYYCAGDFRADVFTETAGALV